MLLLSPVEAGTGLCSLVYCIELIGLPITTQGSQGWQVYQLW